MRKMLIAGLGCLIAACQTRTVDAPRVPPGSVPPYKHIFVIIDENKGYNEIMDHPELTPVIHQLANTYGTATQFYAEVHSSEGNYIALLGGDTFGIHDDDAFYCRTGVRDGACENARQNGYANHDLTAPSLMDQLAQKGLTWKAYLQAIPAPGSLVPRWPTKDYPFAGLPVALYAAKHNGFVNFARVNRAPYDELAWHFVGFNQLDQDLAAGTMPNYAHIIPDECDDMHGLSGDNVPAGCNNEAALIKRGDAVIGVLVSKIMNSKVWSEPGNSAIVVTFDENDKAERSSGAQGCCGYDPNSRANFGGGHIPTIVITNHGPRHFADATPYNHYSLLRTTEAAFGINHYLGQAANSGKGVVTMTPLFAVRP